MPKHILRRKIVRIGDLQSGNYGPIKVKTCEGTVSYTAHRIFQYLMRDLGLEVRAWENEVSYRTAMDKSREFAKLTVKLDEARKKMHLQMPEFPDGYEVKAIMDGYGYEIRGPINYWYDFKIKGKSGIFETPDHGDDNRSHYLVAAPRLERVAKMAFEGEALRSINSATEFPNIDGLVVYIGVDGKLGFKGKLVKSLYEELRVIKNEPAIFAGSSGKHGKMFSMNQISAGNLAMMMMALKSDLKKRSERISLSAIDRELGMYRSNRLPGVLGITRMHDYLLFLASYELKDAFTKLGCVWEENCRRWVYRLPESAKSIYELEFVEVLDECLDRMYDRVG